MAKKGALKSTLIVTSDELKVNGGRWLLQSGPAIRVRGFKESTIGDRRIIGGDALPIYVLAESDARVNGGQFLLKGGQPIQVTDVIGSARGVIQGKAIPVWPVDDDGNYDADFAGISGPPSEIDGLILWLRADAITGLNDGDAVATWPDSSGQGNDAIGVAGSLPTWQDNVVNGQPVVRFDGVNNLLNTPNLLIPSNTTIFIVTLHKIQTAGGSIHRPVLSADNDAYIVTGNGYGMTRRRAGSDGFQASLADGVAEDVITDLQAANNNFQNYVLVKSGTATTLYRNGASVGVAVFSRVAGFHTGYDVGGSNFSVSRFYDGDMPEVIVYDSALSDANRAIIDAYISTRYGI